MSDLGVGLVERPALRSRHDCGYVTLRSWRCGDRKKQIAAFKVEKKAQRSALVEIAADEIAAFIRKFLPIDNAVVTSVPCGHSRRADCFGKRLAQATALRLDHDFLHVWEDRFCEGVSHPKEFAKLPPLVWRTIPDRFTIVVDDVATSGWHLEEAVGALRGFGIPALALAWIGGSIVEDRDRRQSEANGSSDGDGDRPRSPFWHGRGVWRV